MSVVPKPRQETPTEQQRRASLRRLFGARLRTLREEAGLDQDAVVRATGRSRTYYSGIENGKHSPTLDWLSDVAAVLGVTVADLVTGLPTAKAVTEPPKPRGRPRRQPDTAERATPANGE